MHYLRCLVILHMSVFIFACSDAGLTGSGDVSGDSDTSASLPRKFAEVQITDLDGKVRDPSALLNKPVFLNIWATWCKPCREEIPAIVRAMNAIGDTSIHFIFASPEPASDVIPFTKEHSYDVDYAIILNADELNVSALPTTFIFNSSGEIVFSEAGYRDWGKPQNVDLIKKMIK